MNYQQALLYLDRYINYETIAQYHYKRAYNLQRIKRLLHLLKDPHKDYPSVIVAGTKAKGSTTTIISSILTHAGIRTATYTSPHLVCIRERVKIDGVPITEAEFAAILSHIRKIIEYYSVSGLTFFELVTTVGFYYFAKKKVDIAVLEVGLGGRLDATNVVSPIVCAITPISYDHTQLLGSSLAEIAREKAGIIKKNCFIVSASQPAEAMAIVKKTARKKKASLFTVGKDIRYKKLKISLEGTRFDADTARSSYKDYYLPLIGRHQAVNACVALAVIERLIDNHGFSISGEAIRKGLAGVHLPGRFQVIKKGALYILDGAHNGASALMLRRTLAELFPNKGIILILGISSDKDSYEIGKQLCTLAEEVIFTRAASPRAHPPELLASKLGYFCKSYYVTYDAKDALLFARGFSSGNDIIVISGSLFLIGDALKELI